MFSLVCKFMGTVWQRCCFHPTDSTLTCSFLSFDVWRWNVKMATLVEFSRYSSSPWLVRWLPSCHSLSCSRFLLAHLIKRILFPIFHFIPFHSIRSIATSNRRWLNRFDFSFTACYYAIHRWQQWTCACCSPSSLPVYQFGYRHLAIAPGCVRKVKVKCILGEVHSIDEILNLFTASHVNSKSRRWRWR
jgi:hypothetical protein